MADSSGNSSAVAEKEPVEQHTEHRSHSYGYADLAEIDHHDADLLGMDSAVFALWAKTNR